MHTVKLLTLVLVVGSLMAGCGQKSNQPASGGTSENNSSSTSSGSGENNASGNSASQPAATQPDNSGRNERDRTNATLTPGDQGGNDADRETTRRIRRAITSNDQLSTDAKNIKVITANGKVTLRGPVKNEQEKKTIDSIVQQMGVSSVDDQLEVKGDNQ